MRFYRILLREKLSRRLADFLVAFQMKRVWRRFRPDLVHVCWVDRRAYICAKADLHPLVLSVWGSDINGLLGGSGERGLKEAVGQALAAADVVIVETPPMGVACAQVGGGQICTEALHLGVDLQQFRPGYEDEARRWRVALEIPDGAVVLYSARALHPLYNHHLILKAFAAAVQRSCAQGFLVFKPYNAVGQGYEEGLRQSAEDLGVSSRIRWISELEAGRIHEVYALCDIVVNFPAMDSFPAVFLEAAACERRILTCWHPTYGSRLEPFLAVVPPGDVAQLEDAMVHEMEIAAVGPDQFAGSARRARAIVKSEYSAADYPPRITRIYEQAVKKHSLSLVGNEH